MGSRTLWLWIFVGCLAVTALVGVVALLLPRVPFEEELLATSALLTGYSLLGLGASLAIARARALLVAWASVSALSVSLAIWLVLIWLDTWIHWQIGETVAKFGATFTIAGVLALHGVLLSLPMLTRDLGRWTRRATVGGAIGGGLLVCLLLWDVVPWSYEETIARFAGAMLIPAALGTIAVPVLARIEHVTRRDDEERTIGRHVPVRFCCPRCARESEQLANRRFLCPGCGLQATITLAEPRCVCGYLLHGLPQPVCPECGRTVEAESWWRPAEAVGDGPPPDADDRARAGQFERQP